MKLILQKEAPVLRQKAKVVPTKDIGTPRLQAILQDMKDALAKEADGVGLAAPQIGVPLRIFIVSEMVFSSLRENGGIDEKGDSKVPRQLVYINPEIIATSKDKKQMEEGCLSVRPLFGKVRRASKATIRAYDEHGQAFERGASGLLAQIFQHEVDHLDGILFIDKAKDIREMPVPEQIQTDTHN